MKIELTLPEHAAGYVRHARRQALLTVGEEPRPELLAPSPFSMYLLAYDGDESTPLGMVEFAMHDQVYRSFEESPYAPFHLEQFGSLDVFAGTRTIFVEPAARAQMPPWYLLLSLAGTRIAYDLGARFTTVSTIASNKFLMNLYRKTGGTLVGTARDESQVGAEIAVWVIDLEELMNHRAMKRLHGTVEIDPLLLRTVRSRTRWDAELKCA